MKVVGAIEYESLARTVIEALFSVESIECVSYDHENGHVYFTVFATTPTIGQDDFCKIEVDRDFSTGQMVVELKKC